MNLSGIYQEQFYGKKDETKKKSLRGRRNKAIKALAKRRVKNRIARISRRKNRR